MLEQNKSHWLDFLKDIKQAQHDVGCKPGNEVFFRGHTKQHFTLTPGLLRNEKLVNGRLISKELWKIESDLFYEFRSKAKGLHGSDITDWDVLFYMQHHRLRTRLLDWTDILGVALYFALGIGNEDRMASDYSPCIWILNPYELNYASTESFDLYDPERLDFLEEDGEKVLHEESYSELLIGAYDPFKGKMLNWKRPIALYPIRKGDRITNQGGYFTIHGNDIRPIERQEKIKKFVKKVIIPKDAIAEAEEFLEYAGINEFTLFPDLDGLAKHLNLKYFK